MTREELLVERITIITKIATGTELNNMRGIEVDKDFNEAILQALIKAAKIGMKFADEHPHWISVEEELPKEHEWILGFSPKRSYIDIYNFDSNGLIEAHGITHWMPLPSVEHLKKGGEG